MNFIVALIIKLAVFCLFLVMASQLFKDFKIKSGGVIFLGVLLLATNWIVGGLIKIITWLPKLITFGIFNFLFVWLAAVCILWVTDKISDQLEIKSTSTLIYSGAIFAIVNALLARFL